VREAVAQDSLPCLQGEGLVDSVDIYCENIAFSAEQADILFKAASL
jgi:imidazolonepropionase